MKRTAPEPNTTNPPRHLIIAINADADKDLEPRDNVRRFSFTPGLDDDWVFREFLSYIGGMLPSYDDDDSDGAYHLDSLAYLCGSWDEERPPTSLPGSLWFTPRAELGKWEKLKNHEDSVRTHQGPWLSVTELSVSFRDHDKDTRSARQIDEDTWRDMIEDTRVQEEKRKLREAKEAKKEL